MDRFLMLGRQHLYLSREEAEDCPALRPFADGLELMKESSSGFAEDFVRSLGAVCVESLDFSDYEGASLVHDLNQAVPDEWHARYDLVFDGGSLEHVFQFPTALKSAMEMVREGGHFVAATPSNHFNGHGFYQLSAELFYRALSPENGFSIRMMAFSEQMNGGRTFRVEDPARLGHRIVFGGRGPLLLFVVARRDEVCGVFSKNPAQSDYARVWACGGAPKADQKRRFQTLRSMIPRGLMHRYDVWRIRQRRRREAGLGVHPVKSFAEALQAFPKPPC